MQVRTTTSERGMRLFNHTPGLRAASRSTCTTTPSRTKTIQSKWFTVGSQCPGINKRRVVRGGTVAAEGRLPCAGTSTVCSSLTPLTVHTGPGATHTDVATAAAVDAAVVELGDAAPSGTGKAGPTATGVTRASAAPAAATDAGAVGQLLGVLAVTIAVLWLVRRERALVTLVIGISMVLSMVIAGLAGAAIPLALTKLRQDPAQSSSIVLTTVTDVAGFFSFLGIATLLLHSM